jgi:hypothetical protein
MHVKNQTMEENEVRDLALLIETAGELVTGLQDLAGSVEASLAGTSDVEDVIALLSQKKAKVDTLKAVALQITSRLKVNADG